MVCVACLQSCPFQIQEFSVLTEYSYWHILLQKHLRFAWLDKEPEINPKDTLKNKLSEIGCRVFVGSKHPNKSL